VDPVHQEVLENPVILADLGVLVDLEYQLVLVYQPVLVDPVHQEVLENQVILADLGVLVDLERQKILVVLANLQTLEDLDCQDS
jgi:hypothetical protein